jgi:hypothetical protein
MFWVIQTDKGVCKECSRNTTECAANSPTEGNMASFRCRAHARVQLKKLPYALAVSAATRHPHFARREMAQKQLDALAGRKPANGLTTL